MISNEDKVAALKKMFSEDIELFGKFFFPHHLKMDTPDFHREIYQIYESPARKIAMGAPRGHAKSTLTDLVYLSWVIIHQKAKFILLVSDTYSQATLFMEALKAELEENDKLKSFYGSMQSKNWSEDEIIANGIMIKCLGAGMKVRGLKFRENRPDLIIVDDLENEDLVNSKERREKLERWFNGALLPSMDVEGRIIMIGTVLHYDCLMSKVLSTERYQDFYKKTYRAIMDGKALWPEHLSIEALGKIKDDYTKNGYGYLFYQEYMNDPVSDENRSFKPEKMRFYEEKELQGKLLKCYITIDRAYSAAKTADYTGIVINRMDKENNWYIRAERFKGSERELIEKIFDLKEFFKPIKIGIEQKAFEYTIKPALKDEMSKRNKFFQVEELKDAGQSKVRRIEGLLPRYEMGAVYFLESDTDLIDELTRFPRAAHDDLCLDGETLVATITGDKKIKDMVKGDRVLTPTGSKKVIWAGQTGEREVVENIGIVGTPDHKVFNGSSFDNLDTLDYNSHISKFNLINQIIWKYKNLLYSMEQPTASWEGRESIISVNQIQMKDGKMLKDFMWRFGNFIMGWKLAKALSFITRTAILLTTTLAIWSAYQLGNTCRNIAKRTEKILNLLQKTKSIWIASDLSQKTGTPQRKDENGIESTQLVLCTNVFTSKVALSVGRCMNLLLKKASFVLGNATENTAQENLENDTQTTTLRKVYNLTVEHDHVFYANGILVSNCDALAYQLVIANYRPSFDKGATEVLKSFDFYNKGMSRGLTGSRYLR